jgi:hypothetical protein
MQNLEATGEGASRSNLVGGGDLDEELLGLRIGVLVRVAARHNVVREMSNVGGRTEPRQGGEGWGGTHCLRESL